MCDDVSVNVCSVYFNIIKVFANLFCVGYIQSILHGDYINIILVWMHLYNFDRCIHILYVNICVLIIYKFINIIW